MEKHPLGNWRCHKEGSQQDWFLTDHWSDWVTVGHMTAQEPITVARPLDCYDWSGLMRIHP